MSGKYENSIRVRLKDSQSETLQALCDQTGKSKSDVVRLLLDAQRGATKTNTTTAMTNEERIEFMRSAGTLVTEVNKLTSEINKIGININQMTKALHGTGRLTQENADVLNKSVAFNRRIQKEVQGELKKIWESLG